MKYASPKTPRHTGPTGNGKQGPYDHKGMATNVGNPGTSHSAQTAHGKSVTIQRRSQRG